MTKRIIAEKKFHMDVRYSVGGAYESAICDHIVTTDHITAMLYNDDDELVASIPVKDIFYITTIQEK